MITKSLDRYNWVVSRLEAKGVDHVIRNRGRSWEIYIDDKLYLKYVGFRVDDKIESDDVRKRAVRLLGDISRAIGRYLEKNDAPEKLKPEYSQVRTIYPVWDSTPSGTEYMIVDIRHCYWRAAYLLGYIPIKLYLAGLQPLPDDEFSDPLKIWRNIGLARLTQVVTVKKKIGKTVISTTSDLKLREAQLYENIRVHSANVIARACKELPQDCLLKINTDAIHFIEPANVAQMMNCITVIEKAGYTIRLEQKIK